MQVNKGPHSAAVVAEARRLGALAVRGNHDDAGLAAYLDHRAGRPVKVPCHRHPVPSHASLLLQVLCTSACSRTTSPDLGFCHTADDDQLTWWLHILARRLVSLMCDSSTVHRTSITGSRA